MASRRLRVLAPYVGAIVSGYERAKADVAGCSVTELEVQILSSSYTKILGFGFFIAFQFLWCRLVHDLTFTDQIDVVSYI